MSGRRVRRVVLLLESLEDFEPAPETWTGKLQRRSTVVGRGPVASRWEGCSGCGGRGVVRDRFRRELRCEVCGGRGRVKVDGYTGRVAAARSLSLAELIVRDTVTAPCNVCMDLHGVPSGVVRGERCWRCDGSGRMGLPGSWLSEPASGGEGGSVDAVTAAIDRRDRAGSYHDVERRLGELVERDPLAGRLVVSVHVRRSAARGDLAALQVAQLEVGLGWIAERMPDPIRVPSGVVAAAERREKHLRALRGAAVSPQALRARDKRIRELYRDGRGVQWLAGEFGLSVRRVYEILDPA